MRLAESLTPELRPEIDTLELGTRRSGLSRFMRGKSCGHGRAARSYRYVVMVAPSVNLYAQRCFGISG